MSDTFFVTLSDEKGIFTVRVLGSLSKMSNKRYFGTDGIRGSVGQYPITPDFMLKLGWATGCVLSNGERSRILIGKDTRISGYMFESALEAGLSAAGAEVLLLGPMPTPAIAYLTRTFRADAGIVISASHNPHADNGVKFFSKTGKKLADEVELQIETALEHDLEIVASERLGKARRVEDAAGRYIEFCKSAVARGVDLKGFKLVLDCAQGATYHIAPRVFEELGAQVISMGVCPDGLNINHECGSTEPEALSRAVIDHQADAGIAFDGDGDRVVMVDAKGQVLDGDEILYVIASHRVRTGQPCKGVIGTVMSNLGLELGLRELGVLFDRTKVGDRYVMEAMQNRGWLLGGESSGHIICLDLTTTGDGIVSALQVMQVMAQSGLALSQLKRSMTKYPQCLVNVRLKQLEQTMSLEAYPNVAKAVRSVEDNLGSQGRVLLRPSGTEPVIRVMVEGQEYEQVQVYANTIAEAVKTVVGE